MIVQTVFSAGLGLALRSFIDVITGDNVTLAGILVGVSEGAVLHHFLYHSRSFGEHLLAYGLRVIADFMWNEDAERLLMVLLWTGLGMLAWDLWPAVSYVVFKVVYRMYRHARRVLLSIDDLVTEASSIPSRVRVYTTSATNSSTSSSRTSSPRIRRPRRKTSQPIPGSFSDTSTLIGAPIEEHEWDSGEHERESPSLSEWSPSLLPDGEDIALYGLDTDSVNPPQTLHGINRTPHTPLSPLRQQLGSHLTSRNILSPTAFLSPTRNPPPVTIVSPRNPPAAAMSPRHAPAPVTPPRKPPTSIASPRKPPTSVQSPRNPQPTILSPRSPAPSMPAPSVWIPAPTELVSPKLQGFPDVPHMPMPIPQIPRSRGYSAGPSVVQSNVGTQNQDDLDDESAPPSPDPLDPLQTPPQMRVKREMPTISSVMGEQRSSVTTLPALQLDIDGGDPFNLVSFDKLNTATSEAPTTGNKDDETEPPRTGDPLDTVAEGDEGEDEAGGRKKKKKGKAKTEKDEEEDDGTKKKAGTKKKKPAQKKSLTESVSYQDSLTFYSDTSPS
ncbi:hypothetical protein JAAARDRAFT_180782 [Jaapia argillacea MUCL 33604]|uniref:Uncharacterized protein n=1 Tax=Jaapia argillacea MUCL 33604 TaxID=933084 RepID=A0A067PM14_9AGAM|nr:hypothetical protein JAAARDRAFT_180782 [Jaapia argillacea MUCL 33604]